MCLSWAQWLRTGIQADRLGEAGDHVGLLNPDTDSWLHVLMPAEAGTTRCMRDSHVMLPLQVVCCCAERGAVQR